MVRHYGLVVLLVLLANTAGFGQSSAPFKIDLDEVPLYQQLEEFWCGAACLQMMMMGYPDPNHRKCFTQEIIDTDLDSNETAPKKWAASPDAMEATITNLNPPAPPGRYQIFAGKDPRKIMYSVLYWMTKRMYPTAVLVNGGSHWVVVRGFETDIDPTTIDPATDQVTLITLRIHDPAPSSCDQPLDLPCTLETEGDVGGCYREVTAASWSNNEWIDEEWWTDFKLWKYGVTGSGLDNDESAWKDQFVALVEPPAIDGSVAEETRRICGDQIPPDRIIELARRHIFERRLHENDLFHFLKETEPTGPHLVDAKPYGYYIVPFQNEETGAIPGAMLLDALTGNFQEMAACNHNLGYLTVDEAITHVMRATDAPPTSRFRAKLEFEWCRETSSRYQPLWKVEVIDGGSYTMRYVDQCGRVHQNLTYHVPPLSP